MNQRFFVRQLVSRQPSSRQRGVLGRVRLGSIGLPMKCAAMTAMVSLSSTIASAQEGLRPPKAEGELSSPKIIMIGVGVLLTAAVVFAATRKAKRSHQD